MTNDYVTDINVGKIEGDDCISRQEAISAIIDEYYPDAIAIDIVDSIANLPSVQPTRPTTQWKKIVDDFKKCSKCGKVVKTYRDYKYCPECGAKMQEAETKIEQGLNFSDQDTMMFAT